MKKFITRILFFLLTIGSFSCGSFWSFDNRSAEEKSLGIWGPVDRALGKIGKQLANEHNLKLILVAEELDKDVHWGLRFTSERTLTLDEGEALIAKLLIDFVKQVSQSKEASNVVAKWSNTHEKDRAFKKEPFASRYFFVRLAFWDKDVNRMPPPYLAQIEVAEDEVKFYYADPKTQRLAKPIEKKLSKTYGIIQG